jgi:aminoglycoside phosphotransferase (APT) family kinase protein
MIDPSLPTGILDWIEGVSGGLVDRAEQLTGGNRRQSWAIDVAESGRRLDLFLRYDPLPDPDDEYTVRRESHVYRALQDTAVPISRIVAMHPSLEAMLLERVAGDSAFPTAQATPVSAVAIREDVEDIEAFRVTVARNFIRALADLHAVDPRAHRLQELGAPDAPMREHVLEELRLWEGLYEAHGVLEPMIELGLGWLKANVPDVTEAAVIVHGDAGPGNFMFDRSGSIAALVDWEFCHLGDPIEDLAWLSVRQAYIPFPDFADLVSVYERHSGRRIDPQRLLYYQIMVLLRIVIIRHRGSGDALRSGDVAASLISRCLSRRLLIEALTTALGEEMPGIVVPDVPDTRLTAIHDGVIKQLENVVIPQSEPLVAKRASNIAFVIRYLRSADRLGGCLVEQGRQALEAVLDRPCPDLADGQLRLARGLRCGAIEPRAALHYLGQAVQLDNEEMRPAMGSLSDNHLPSTGPAPVSTTKESR